jgi:hypothetical protein
MTKVQLFNRDDNTDPATVFQNHLDKLNAIGDSDRTHIRIQQCLGVVSAIGFGVVATAGATVAAPIAAAGLACAAGLYALPTFKEAARTGGFRPLPFVDADLVKLLTMADSKQSGFDSGEVPALEGYHYLSARAKAEYTLIGTFGNMIADVMRNIPQERRATEWHRLVSLFISRYGKVIRESPHALRGEVDPAKLAGFLTETPEQAKARIASLRSALDDEDWDDDDDDAIEVAAVSAQGEKAKVTPTVDAVVQNVTKDVVEAFVNDLRCTVLCAPPRTGKGIVAAGMMAGFKLVYPAGKLFSSTIKQFTDEDWYFSQSDAHINPSVKDPIALAKSLYNLYTAWETSESTADAPSLYVFDELRDTLLALKGVKCEDVSPDIESMEPKFDDWLRHQLISAATLNQCHRRYLLLISPTSTAQGMIFKDANSLQSYSSFTLVTPSELAFSEGNNGIFAAPAIRPDSPLWSGWYGLAWHSKTKQWFGVPSVPKDAIALRESQAVDLNYFEKPTMDFESVFPASMLGTVSAIGSTVTKTKAKAESYVSPESRTDNLIEETYQSCFQQIRDLAGEETTITKLIPKEATRRKIGASVIARLSGNGNIEYRDLQVGNSVRHFFRFIIESEDTEMDV